MDYSLAMAIMNCTDYLFEKSPCFFFLKLLFLFEKVFEFSAFQILHDNNELHILESVTVYYFYDIWMAKRLHVLGLPKNHIDRVRRDDFVGFHNFNGSVFIGYFINAERHRTKASFPQSSNYLIFSKISIRIEIIAFAHVNTIPIL